MLIPKIISSGNGSYVVVKYKASPSLLMSIYFKRDVTPIGEGDVK